MDVPKILRQKNLMSVLLGHLRIVGITSKAFPSFRRYI